MNENKEMCPVCLADIDYECDDPCGAADCPLGVSRQAGDPRPLDFSQGHEDDWLLGEE